MLKLFLKTILFVSIGLVIHVICLFITTAYLESIHLDNGETESNMWIIKKNQSYDLLILGSSHGRVFSRHYNHARVENVLHAKMINLSQGGGGGFSPMLVYLNTFYDRGNRAKKIVMFLDPWMFFREESNDSYKYYRDDYFMLRHFMNVIKYGNISYNGLSRLFVRNNRNNYTFTFTSLFTKHGLEESWYQDICDDIVDESNYSKTRQYQLDRYTYGLDENMFNRNKKILEKLIAYFTTKALDLTIMIPPTLTAEMGHKHTIRLIEELRTQYEFDFKDLSKAIPEERYFYDLDHLNTEGVKFFAKKFLSPLLTGP